MAHWHNVKSLISLMMLTVACVSAGAREANFDKTLQVTSVEAQTGSQVLNGTGGTYSWHKIIGEVDGRGYSFKPFCRWRWSDCNWLLPGKFPARWIDRSTLEIEYRDNKGQSKTEKIYVLDVFDITPDEKSAQVSPAPTSEAPRSSSNLTPRVSVVSTPDGADIEIDGSFVGSTPSALNVAAGEHSVVIKKAGYETWERKLKVTGGDITLRAELEKQR
jgi:hypothetical protein